MLSSRRISRSTVIRQASMLVLLLCCVSFSTYATAANWQVAQSRSGSYKLINGEHQVKFFLKVTKGSIPAGELLGLHVNRQQEHPNYQFRKRIFSGYRLYYAGGKGANSLSSAKLSRSVVSKFQPLKQDIILPGRHEFYIELSPAGFGTEIEVELRFKGSWDYLCTVRAELPGFNSTVTAKRCKKIRWNGVAPDPEPQNG